MSKDQRTILQLRFRPSSAVARSASVIPPFSAGQTIMVEDGLSSYERVSTHNKWDDAMKQNNVIVYLTGVAHLWYRNHEVDITTWAAFKASFTEIFGRPVVLKLRAQQRLRIRAQHTGEVFTSFIEDVVDLCNASTPL